MFLRNLDGERVISLFKENVEIWIESHNQMRQRQKIAWVAVEMGKESLPSG